MFIYNTKGTKMTIQKPIITELRYVNGQPDPNLRPDQTRINWAKNGESLNGASGDTVSDGVLNRAGVEIQENVLNSHNNTKSQQAIIEELVDTVNDLTGGGDANLGARVTQTEFDIDVLDGQVSDLQDDVGVAGSIDVLATGLHKSVEDIEDDIGVRNSNDIPNEVENNDTVRKDLYFIKRRIGNDRNYDVNGNPSPSTNPTGIKFQIEDLYNKTATINTEIGENAIPLSINGRLYELEQNSQVGDVAELRSEIGDPLDADPGRSIYLRLDDAESTITDNTTDITALQGTIDTPTTGLVDRVASSEQSIIDTNTQVTTNTSDISSIVTDLGSYSVGDVYAGTVKARLSDFNDDFTSLWNRVGATDADTGTISFRVAGLEASLGDRDNPVAFTAWYSIQENRGLVDSAQADVDGLLTVVGQSDDEVGTLRARVLELEARSDYALITSDTPVTVVMPTTPTDVFSLFNSTSDTAGFTFTGGVITREGLDFKKPIVINWIMVSPSATDVTIRVDILHDDMSNESSESTRTLRAGAVTPITIPVMADLHDLSEIRIYAHTSDAVTIEHESFMLKL
ncbi:Wac fibritin neck whiskers [Vibrio phage nt-1]|uniref:Wac fibritin neck whiskers n=1 Tax=Vibrio phage nt-1 TaxID=115992 RepID=R9TIV4_9CAUD|nr:fibritin neck whisker [Vibrio phage nt-1]AGN30022.2 Wac fibritin neck whiskers [Vibrio phage nt-1]